MHIGKSKRKKSDTKYSGENSQQRHFKVLNKKYTKKNLCSCVFNSVLCMTDFSIYRKCNQPQLVVETLI